MALRISRALQAQMLAEAASAPEREICGLLFGTSGEHVAAAHSCANVAADPSRAFEIDPLALIAAHKAQRGGGPNLIGWYHSHPNGRPEPSPCDRDAANEVGKLWLIIAQGNVRAWRATGAGTLLEIPLELVD